MKKITCPSFELMEPGIEALKKFKQKELIISKTMENLDNEQLEEIIWAKESEKRCEKFREELNADPSVPYDGSLRQKRYWKKVIET